MRRFHNSDMAFWVSYRLLAVLHFSSGIVERAKRERAWKSPHARKGDTRRGERKMRYLARSGDKLFFDLIQLIDLTRPKFDVWPNIFLSPRCVSPFLEWGDFHSRSRFACSTIPEEKWGTTCNPGQLTPMILLLVGLVILLPLME